MIFSDDTTLLSFFQHYEDEREICDAIIRYVSGGVLEANRPVGLAQPKDADDLDQLSSPTDSAIDMKKRKRMNQHAAQERAKQAEQKNIIGVADCEDGFSPQLSKGSLMSKKM